MAQGYSWLLPDGLWDMPADDEHDPLSDGVRWIIAMGRLRDSVVGADCVIISKLVEAALKQEQEINDLKAALEEIAGDIDPKQTWTYVAVQRRLIARNALDKLKSVSV